MCYLHSKEGDSISLQGATELNIAELGIQLMQSIQTACGAPADDEIKSINCYVASDRSLELGKDRE